jgi:hypothetical protein
MYQDILCWVCQSNVLLKYIKATWDLIQKRKRIYFFLQVWKFRLNICEWFNYLQILLVMFSCPILYKHQNLPIFRLAALLYVCLCHAHSSQIDQSATYRHFVVRMYAAAVGRKNKTPWSESVSEQYRSSDRRLSAK